MKVPLFFWFNLFLETRAEILLKKLRCFLVQTMTPKSPFEINWHLNELYPIWCKNPRCSVSLAKYLLPSTYVHATEAHIQLLFCFNGFEKCETLTWVTSQIGFEAAKPLWFQIPNSCPAEGNAIIEFTV